MVKITEKIEQGFGPQNKTAEVGRIATVAVQEPMILDCGVEIGSFPLAFQTYGELNSDRTNAILICHGLTADQYVASVHPVTGKPGWWEFLVGAGKPIDTDRFFVVCANALGSCMGSYGPKSLNPQTGKPFGLDFPVVTVADMVRAQSLLIDALEIKTLAAVIGGSMGGMLALEWMSSYPERLNAAIAIATSARHSAQNIAFNEIGRQAIMVDEGWQSGRYFEKGTFPSRGLAVARMAAHVTYLSEMGLQQKFGRDLQDREAISYGFEADFQIESYLRYQGKSFVERFDPNSYFYITRAMDYFDLAGKYGGVLSHAFTGARHIRSFIISFDTDWLFPTSQAKEIVRALNVVGAPVSFAEMQSDKGHDGFLLPNAPYEQAIRGFLGALEC